MLRNRIPVLVSSLPLALLGSLSSGSFAGELFFPVLEESGSHWFSWFDPDYVTHAVQRDAVRNTTTGQMSAGHASWSSGLPPEPQNLFHDAYADSQIDNPGHLVAVYREQGRYAEAFDQLERRYFLARVTLGLHDARHIPLLEEMVELAQMKGDLQRSHELREALLHLQLRVFDEGDVRHTEALLSWAEWHLKRFLAESAGYSLAAGYSADIRLHPDFAESDRYFMRALRKLAVERPPGGDHRLTLLQAMRKWQTLHLAAFRRQHRQPGLQQHDQLAAGQGFSQSLSAATHPWYALHMLRPTLDDLHDTPDPEPELQAIQLLQLADWQHMIGLPGASTRTYEQALGLLRSADIPDARRAELLGPGLPVPDPEHWYRFHRQTVQFRGYLDVEIGVDGWGHAVHTALIDPAAHETRLGKALLQHIANSSFRPLSSTGTEVPTYRLRYYYE